MSVPPLVFAAHGDQGRSWAEVIRRSRGLELRAAIDLAAGGVEGLDRALAAWPDAAVAAWAAGPLEALRLAEHLAARGAPSVLHPAPSHAVEGDGLVQLTHGWVTLAGVAAIEHLFASRVDAVRLRVRGLPESPAPGLAPVLYQALALVLRFGRDVRVERAVLEDEQQLSVSLDVDRVPWRLDVGARKGPELSVVVRTSGGDYSWSADAVSESLERPGAERRAVPSVSWAERCVRQLATPVRGARLADARAARALMDEVEQALERRLPPIPPRIDLVRTPMSMSLLPPPPEVAGTFRAQPQHELAARRKVGLERLGLLGDVPPAAPLAPRAPPSGSLPFEALAYRLELRPAVFITTDLASEERVRAGLPGTIERRERFVATAAGDPFDDDRDNGEMRVELFAARDPATARRLAELQTADPTESAEVIGGLLGYPACCVQAFARQADRSDNSYNRYAIAARTSWGPWPRVLDDTSLKLVPHFACTYRCERSKAQAESVLEALAEEDPALHAEVRQYLGGPVLYFDHDHQLRFDGAVSDGGIAYRMVSIPWPGPDAFATLAGAIARGNRLVLGDRELAVYREGELLFTLERTDPGLGLILPFAAR